LHYAINEVASTDPILYKEGRIVKYKLEIDPLQKYCVDALSFQESKQESVLAKTLKKEKHLLEIYSDKLEKLRVYLSGCNDEGKKREVLQVLEMYERM